MTILLCPAERKRSFLRTLQRLMMSLFLNRLRRPISNQVNLGLSGDRVQEAELLQIIRFGSRKIVPAYVYVGSSID